VYAEVVGFGAAHSGGAEGDEDDEGVRFAIEAALEDAGVAPGEIDAIVPLACGVASADRAEARALRGVFGEGLKEIPLVTVSPNVGNCLAGIGGVQAAVAAKCLMEQQLPARIHAGTPMAGMQAGAAGARRAELGNVLVCTGSLGGQNAALVLREAANI
jgi:3-oxoacyl-(acyl-carrier-protein) synthase